MDTLPESKNTAVPATDTISPLNYTRFKTHPIKTLTRKNTPATLPVIEKLTGF